MAKLVDNNATSNEEIEARVEEVAKKIEILRVRYEQYFVGIEKVPPTTLRMDVARVIRELEQVKLKNTAIKFKIRTQIQKFTSYSTYWNRTMREIEDGTYRRHKEKMRHKAATMNVTEAAKTAAKTPEPVIDQASVDAVADEAADFLESLGLAAAHKPAAPVVKPVAPVIKPAAPVIKPAAPVIKPAAPVIKPAVSAQTAGSGMSSSQDNVARTGANPVVRPPIARRPTIIAAAKDSDGAPVNRPSIVGAKPAVVGAQQTPPTQQNIIRSPVVKPAVQPATAKPAPQPGRPAVIRPAIIRPAIIQPAKPAIVQPAKPQPDNSPTASGGPNLPPVKQ